MSHQIENNQLAYVGDVPWHGLGIVMQSGATGEQMLKAAGLNWKVQRRAIAMRDPLGKAMLTEQLNGFRAIVRADNNHVFQVASDRYHPVQNLEIVDFFREYCEAGHAQMETVGALRDGAVIWALAKLNGGSTLSLQGVDPLQGYMLLATSHDGSLKTIGQPTQIRVVCHNTLSASLQGQGDHTFRLNHAAKFDGEAKQRAKATMGMAIEQIAKMNYVADKLSRVHIEPSDWITFMTKLMGGDIDKVISADSGDLTKMASEIQEDTATSPGANLKTAKGTLWGAVNGVSYWVDHRSRSRNQQNRIFNAWFGRGDELKTQAIDVAMEMAEVTVG